MAELMKPEWTTPVLAFLFSLISFQIGRMSSCDGKLKDPRLTPGRCCIVVWIVGCPVRLFAVTVVVGSLEKSGCPFVVGVDDVSVPCGCEKVLESKSRRRINSKK